MTRIRIDTVQAENVAMRLTRVGHRLHEIRWQLNHAVGQLDLGVWEGTSRARIEPQLSRIDPEARKLAGRLDELGRKLMHVADVFEQQDSEAAGNFDEMPWVDFMLKAGVAGTGTAVAATGAGVAGFGPDRPPIPSNMRELYNAVKHEGDEYPVKIIQVGENDFLVLIDGTRIEKFGQANNVTGALVSGVGMPGDYERAVQDFIDAQKLPPHANLHLAGHSQGGMVANNLAVNQDFLAKYTVRSVTTFGSPINANENTDAKYYRYRAEGDPVPYLDRSMLYGSVFGSLFLGPLITESHVQSQTLVDTGNHGLWGEKAAHSSYGNEGSPLAEYDCPFTINDKYDYYYHNGGYDWLETKAMPDDTSGIGQIAQGIASLQLGAGDFLTDELTQHLPIGNRINQYYDRICEEAVTTAPTGVDFLADVTGVGTIVEAGEQAVGAVADLAGEAAGEAGEFFGNLFSL